ncbi:hypothetical protein MPER_00747, partial [Moniliophthora perniciosa FA553]
FLETANVTLSLLDWDLESQVYPIVRWLVQHRRAKVVDIVHSGLKTVFTLPPKFDYPLSQLIQEFERDFVVQSKDMILTYHEVVPMLDLPGRKPELKSKQEPDNGAKATGTG